MVTNPQQLPGVVDLAIRNALAKRTVAHLTFPNDLQVAPVSEDPYQHVGPGTAPQSAPAMSLPPRSAARSDLERAAEVLNAGSKVAMLVGVGARHAGEEVLAVAERLGSPIVKTLPGKMVVTDDHPLTTGGLGLLGTRPSEELMEECDTLLMVGTSFPYATHLPPPGQVRMVQIDADPTLIGPRLPAEAPVLGDAKLALAELLTMLTATTDRSFLGGIREYYLTGNLATMAPGLPYAIGIQHAYRVDGE
jgi:pyruvate dehydrogenase (quinone)